MKCLKELAANALICSGCNKFIGAKIWQCRYFHIYCFDCYFNYFPECVKCGSTRSIEQSNILERIVARFKLFACSLNKPVRVIGRTKEQRMEMLNWFGCPMEPPGRKCYFRGTSREMVEHCRKLHESDKLKYFYPAAFFERRRLKKFHLYKHLLHYDENLFQTLVWREDDHLFVQVFRLTKEIKKRLQKIYIRVELNHEFLRPYIFLCPSVCEPQTFITMNETTCRFHCKTRIVNLRFDFTYSIPTFEYEIWDDLLPPECRCFDDKVKHIGCPT